MKYLHLIARSKELFEQDIAQHENKPTHIVLASSFFVIGGAGSIDYFEHAICAMKEKQTWSKQEIVNLFHYMIPGFGHNETGKYLDGEM